MKKIVNINAFAFLLMGISVISCGNDPVAPAEKKVVVEEDIETPELTYSVVAVHRHDTSAYTEGLFFHEGKLFESTGAASNVPGTRSTIGIADLKTGKLNIKAELDKTIYFGEGIQYFDNKIYMLTYTNQACFVFDAKNYNRINQFSYPNREGWGMTTDGEHLIFSDGTANLTYARPDNFSIVKTIAVTEGGYEVLHLNELEYVKGYIYANVWLTNRIVKIDPATGKVVAALHLTALSDRAHRRYPQQHEMNGIAFDPVSQHFFVTGKMWAVVYELFVPL
jgi:glutaminyl-peptide cyclotransferase